jgi:hypothetical protein
VGAVVYCTVVVGGTFQGCVVAGRGGVDEVLGDGSLDHCCRVEEETKGDARDGFEGNADLAEAGADDLVHDGDEDDDCEGVDVLHDVVGDAVEFHLAGLGDQVAEHLAVDDTVDGEEDEDFAGSEGALDLEDGLVVPGGGVGAAKFVAVGGRRPY